MEVALSLGKCSSRIACSCDVKSRWPGLHRGYCLGVDIPIRLDIIMREVVGLVGWASTGSDISFGFST
jgi:hypothetical protein